MICMSCPVFSECQDYRQKIGAEHGIWAAVRIRRGD